MKKHLSLSLTIFTVLLAAQTQADARSVRVKPLAAPTSEALGKNQDWWVGKVKALSNRSFEQRLRYWALSRIGTPYALGHLGEEQHPDKDPVFATGKADCTTFVLTSTALAQSTDFSQARDRMEPLNYRCQGLYCPINYQSRLHFTEDRINGGSSSFQDITKTIKAPQMAFETVKLVLNRKADGAPLLNLHWERPMNLTYLRTGYLTPEIMKQLPNTVGVAFIRKRYFTNGLGVAHEGFLLDKATLVHASTDAKKVVKENLMAYLKPANSDYKHDGVIFFKILPGPNPMGTPLLQPTH